ncbi:MAG: type III pantothenate kinase [Candidatus Theseobacter exili]|nr:type III pantothenate kinase [Candidatus Theseobacter exili]
MKDNSNKRYIQENVLCIDIGNTTMQFCIFEKGVIQKRWSIPTKYCTSESLKQEFDKNAFSSKSIPKTIIASVVPSVSEILSDLIISISGNSPLFLSLESSLGLKTGFKNPESIGSDRIANALAVCAEYILPAVVVDFGTAVTFDIISKDGVYLGGIITAGTGIVLESLHKKTALLPMMEFCKPKSVLGIDTETAISSGVYWGQTGMVKEILFRINKDVFNSKPHSIIVTGGNGAFLVDEIKQIDIYDPDLTLKGIFEAYKRLKETSS